MPKKDTPPLPLGFSGRLVLAIQRAGLSQRSFARRMGVTEGAVSKWVNEEREPQLKALAKMAVVLGVSCDWLVGVPDRPGPAQGPARIDPRAVRRAIAQLREISSAAEALAAALPPEDDD